MIISVDQIDGDITKVVAYTHDFAGDYNHGVIYFFSYPNYHVISALRTPGLIASKIFRVYHLQMGSPNGGYKMSNDLVGSVLRYTWGATSIIKLMSYVYVGGSIDIGTGMCPIIMQTTFATSLTFSKKAYWNCPTAH